MASPARPISTQPIRPGGLHSASPALVMLGRAGYAAKGIVYVVIGALAARAAIGAAGGATTDSRGALSVITPAMYAAPARVGEDDVAAASWRGADPSTRCARS